MSKIEKDEDYDDVRVRHGDYRIIRCPADLQFILQRRRPATGRWVGYSYFMTPKGTKWLEPAGMRPLALNLFEEDPPEDQREEV